VFAVVQNPTAATVTRVQVRLVRYDPATGKPAVQSQPLLIAANIAPNQRGQVAVTGVKLSTQAELKQYGVTIEKAELVK
jgi:hypothetical protein